MISVSPIGSAMSLGHERHPDRHGLKSPIRGPQFSNSLLGAGIAEQARMEVKRATALGQTTSNAMDVGNLPLTAVAHAVVMLRESHIKAEIDHINHKLVLSW